MKYGRILVALVLCVLFTIERQTNVQKAPAEAPETLYCGRSYSQLTQNPGQPLNAVGYLNNGCTAVLIDNNHIAAAAHCFVNTTTGQWQGNLRFYPNFHPDRVSADAANVPRGNVTTIVVGSRAGESVLGDGMDWGIARIENWQDIGGLDMTPARLMSPPSVGAALLNPAYTRHHFPYDDNDSVTWDNMQWDTTFCGWVPPNNGMWAIQMQNPPLFDGVNPDIQSCNSRWAAGMIHDNCMITDTSNGVVTHNCDTVGGSSGSPIMYQNPNGQWAVVGIGHGGGITDFAQLVPTCSPDTPARHDNTAPSAARFEFAPRYASNVAIHRRPDNPAATAVFAVDSDLDRVVYRARFGGSGRAGSSTTYTSPFDYWQSLGTPKLWTGLERIAACSADSSGKPQIFVVGDDGIVYTRLVQPSGSWNDWSVFETPQLSGKAIDIDVTSDFDNRCMAFIVGDGGNMIVRSKTSDTTWSPGSSIIGNGSFKAVTALNYDGAVWVAVVDTAGEIWYQFGTPTTLWNGLTKLPRPSGVLWQDIDMTWDEAARGFMLATPRNSDNRLWFMPMYGGDAWSNWRFFDTNLWAPTATSPQNAPSMESVTASRWMEDPAGTTSPLIFITDDFGNVYFVEYARVGTVGWNLNWKSFYHETIPYP